MRPLIDCCGRFIFGSEKPETAEQLMRSRYTAYALRQYDYILSTTHPSQRRNLSVSELRNWADELVWQKLDILETISGKEKDKTGKVEFVAHYFHPSQGLKTLRERSRFRKHQSQWFYLDAE